MGLLDLNNETCVKISPKLIIITFIQDFLKTDKKIISCLDYPSIDAIEDDDILHVRKNWDDYKFIYLYASKRVIADHYYSRTQPIMINGEPVTFKMIKEYYGIA